MKESLIGSSSHHTDTSGMNDNYKDRNNVSVTFSATLYTSNVEVGDGGLENSLQDWQEWKEDRDNLSNQSYMDEVWYQRSKEVVTQVSKNAEVKKTYHFSSRKYCRS